MWWRRRRKWQSWCPCCRRPLNVITGQMSEDGPSDVEGSLQRRFAYVAGLWGANAGFALGALVLGHSLKRHCMMEGVDRVLLHTDDVPQSTLELLGNVWTTLKRVDYVYANSNLFLSKGTRFDDVFNKLHVFSLTDYDKVVMLEQVDTSIKH